MISTTGEIPIGLYRTKYQDKNEYSQVREKFHQVTQAFIL